MNRLPKYWVVKNPNQIVKDYLAKTYNVPDVLIWNHNFIGFDGTKSYNGVHGTCCLEYLVNDPAILTLDEFIELSKEVDEFVLPGKWCVKCTKENYSVLDKWFFQKTGKHRFDTNKCSYWHYPENSDRNSTSSEIWDGYKEITFDQFQKYVLKLKDMEKKIVGYKLKESCKQYFDAVDIIAREFGSREQMTIEGYPIVIKRLDKAGVLDLWFEPVYEEEYPDITINGYKGEFFNDYVKFGCAEIHKNVFMDLNTLNSDLENGDDIIGMKSNRRIESVTIGKGIFTKEHIRQIAKYYLTKK